MLPDSAQPWHGRILVADDGRETRHFVRVVLERAGLHVDCAENGLIACRIIEAAIAAGSPPDLVLLDIQMPELDGIEITRRLRDAGWGKPIIALTAHTLPEDRERCMRAGFSDYIAKPIDQAELLRLVAHHLGRPALDRSAGLLDDPRILAADRERILAGFLTRLQDRADEIEQAIGDVDRSRILQSAHALHGSAGLFGFTPIAEAARTVEEQIRTDADLTALLGLAAKLIQLCRHTAAQASDRIGAAHERHEEKERI